MQSNEPPTKSTSTKANNTYLYILIHTYKCLLYIYTFKHILNTCTPKSTKTTQIILSITKKTQEKKLFRIVPEIFVIYFRNFVGIISLEMSSG